MKQFKDEKVTLEDFVNIDDKVAVTGMLTDEDIMTSFAQKDDNDAALTDDEKGEADNIQSITPK